MAKSLRIITFMGQTLSLSEWARKYNLNYYTLHRRLARGMSFKDALFKPTKSGVSIGGELVSIPELARIVGIRADVIYGRRQRGWKIRDLAKPLCGKIKLTAFGESLTVNEWAERTGIKERTIRGRLHDGWSVEDALTIAPMPGGIRRNAKFVTFQGKTMTIEAWSREIGVASSALRRRLRSGMPPEYALKVPGKKRKEAT